MSDSAEVEISGAAVPATRGVSADELPRVLREETNQVAEQFGRTLRMLVAQIQELGISQNQLGRRLHATSGTMSKYLSGDRVPDWDFVEALLREVHKITQRELDDSAYEVLRELQQRALFLRHPQRHDVQRITTALDASELRLAELKMREAELKQEVENLQLRLDALRADQDREREQHQTEQNKLRRELEETASRIEQLLQELADLEEQLSRAQERAEAAERMGSAAALVPADQQDDREFGPDETSLLEALVEKYAQARTQEARDGVYGKLRKLPWYAGAAAVVLMDRQHPDVDASAFAAAALSSRPTVEMRDAITWFYRHLLAMSADRLTRLVTLGMDIYAVPNVMEALSRTRGADAALAAVAEAACNDRDDFGRLLGLSFAYPMQAVLSQLHSVLARSVSDAVLFREVHAREQALREAEQSSGKRDTAHATRRLELTLRVLMAGPPASTAARLLWLAPRFQDIAVDQATDTATAAGSLRQLAQIAVQLRRLQGEHGIGNRDLAAHLLQRMVSQAKDPVAVANLLSMWESEAEQGSENVTGADRRLVLLTILKGHAPDVVGQLVTHNAALPPGSTDLVWKPDRLELWQQAVDQLPLLKRRTLNPVLHSITRSAMAPRQGGPQRHV